MKNQKICIIGGNLTGLVTAIALSKFNCDIDLITGKYNKKLKSNRTIAISEDSLNFLNELNIFNSIKKETWICSNMKLYSELQDGKFSEIFELNKENKNENIFYMIENSKLIKLIMKRIEKIKTISLKKNKKVSSINNSGSLQSVKFNNKISKYNLVIVCTGHNSFLIKDELNKKIIENSYKEFAITTILKHKTINNNTARQIFLDNAIFAFLPISNNKTSIVWSIKNSMKDKSNIFFKKKIKLYASKYLKDLSIISNIEKKDLNLIIRSKYYLNRTLLFGDALHVMHPFVGQSFNMTLRDLKCLKKILKEKINLGLDIGSSDVLSEFSQETKPRNFSFSVGSDLLKNMVSLKEARNNIFKILNQSSFAKDVFYNVANKGLKF